MSPFLPTFSYQSPTCPGFSYLMLFCFLKEKSEIVSYEPRSDDYPNRETSCVLFRQFLDDHDREMRKVRSDSAVYSHM